MVSGLQRRLMLGKNIYNFLLVVMERENTSSDKDEVFLERMEI